MTAITEEQNQIIELKALVRGQRVEIEELRRCLGYGYEQCVKDLHRMDRYREALEKIADPRKRDHREPDPQTELYCVMNIAQEALK